jgi:hypothetical protein
MGPHFEFVNKFTNKGFILWKFKKFITYKKERHTINQTIESVYVNEPLIMQNLSIANGIWDGQILNQ